MIAANDISPVNVEEVVQQIVYRGGRAKAYVDDIAKKVAVQNILNQVEDDFGHLDILINHAAVEPHVSLLDMDEWDWHRVLEVNLTGAFLMTQSAGRVMRARGSGVIVNLITDSVPKGEDVAAFFASMEGLRGFTRQAAHELQPYGIQVYAVPDRTETVVEKVFELLTQQVEEK
jgi:3-oxoacyl-[acyl-carrier protein] reductase